MAAATREEKPRRHFSIPFLLAIPGNFLIATVGLIGLASLLQFAPLDPERWVLFGTGMIGGLILVISTKAQTFRVAVHELKHWLLVKLTGNKVKDFHVHDQGGHVQYLLYADKAHFAPVITLAPYFFPLFSLPLLVLCLVLEPSYPLYLCLILGITLAADMSLGIGELHPHQTDFGNVRGGFLACAAYLAGAHVLWVTVCLLWVAGGRYAFVHTCYVAMRLSERFLGM